MPTALGDTPRLTKVGTLKPIVLFQFYKKPMSNQTPNLMRSGLPEGSKRATVTNEIHRRLKNTSRELETSIVSKILREYMDELERGGYPIKWREEVLYSALIGYRRMWEAECSGKGHVNRPEHFTQTKRRAAKLTGSSTWFQKRTEGQKVGQQKSMSRSPKGQQSKIPPKIESVLFCTYTPFSTLKKMLQDEEDRIHGQNMTCRVKVVERAKFKSSRFNLLTPRVSK